MKPGEAIPGFPYGSGHRVRLMPDYDEGGWVVVVRRRVGWEPGDPDGLVPGHMPQSSEWEEIVRETFPEGKVGQGAAKARRSELYEQYCKQPERSTTVVFEAPQKGDKPLPDPHGQQTLF